jgi:hypothetical protein
MVKGEIINSKNYRKGNDYIIIKTKKEIIIVMIARITTRIAAGKAARAATGAATGATTMGIIIGLAISTIMDNKRNIMKKKNTNRQQ